VFDEGSLLRHLKSFLTYYEKRTHLSLEKDTPSHRPVQEPASGGVVAIPQVGGLHHRYERRAAEEEGQGSSFPVRLAAREGAPVSFSLAGICAGHSCYVRRDHISLFGDSDERKDLFERTFTFLAKYLKP
jgi:hypothetical protein